MLEHFFQAEIACRTGKIGGDDVPADPAVGHVIECAEPPGVGERMLVAGGDRRTKCQVFCDSCKAWDNHQRVVRRGLYCPFHCGFDIATVHVVEAKHVSEEEHVEVGLICDTGLVGPEIEGVGSQPLIRGVGPQAWRSTTADAGLLIQGEQEGFGVGHRYSCIRVA